MNNLCPQCGAPASNNSTKCEYCGATLSKPTQQQETYAQQPQQQVIYTQQPMTNPERSNWPVKNKILAGILAIFLGGIGIHKFYLGKTGMGVLYILLCWTYIPMIIGFIEGIIILCQSDENFQIKYHCRIN